MLASRRLDETVSDAFDMKSEIRDGMKIDWDAPIEMDDGVVLRADVFRPVADGQISSDPELRALCQGPCDAGGLQERSGCASSRRRPTCSKARRNKYQNWELFDPEKWVPDGYALVRVDSRGAGRSPGYLEVWSPREAKDIALCVDWAGVQPWSNGKVGIHGISYYSMNQWQAAPHRPKHLAALCIWEGSSDYYRELCRHGGILSRLSSKLVSAPGDRRAARRRRARRQERGDRRAGRRARQRFRKRS